MKVMTILGTRPEIIRLSAIIERLDGLCEHCLVHTGQNFDEQLSDVFFRELKVRTPDHRLEVRGGFAQQAAAVIEGCDRLFELERPDRVLILGDTNSGLAALPACRRGLPVFHMEAGNRCYDPRVPEELNRRLIDNASSVLMPYTERSRANLLREGFDSRRIFVTGNPIYEVLQRYREPVAASTVLHRLGVEPGRFLLATLHRAENVDSPERLAGILQGLAMSAEAVGMPLLMSTHPRLRSRLDGEGPLSVRFLDPLGFFDFVRLQSEAAAVLSDSGTVQEECSILGRPSVTVRDATERPETLEHGSNVLSGTRPDSIVAATLAVLTNLPTSAPAEYRVERVCQTVVNLLLSQAL